MVSEQYSTGDEAEFDRLLMTHGVSAERLPSAKGVLAEFRITTTQELCDLIDIYQGPTDMHQPFPGFQDNDRNIRDIAVRLQEARNEYQSHYKDHD